MNCTYLRQAEDKYFCLKKSVGIDIKICDSCSLRKHSGVKEFISSAVAVVENTVIAKEPILASKELIKLRWKKCKECKPYYKNRRCRVCGCALDIKIRFLATHCPKNKW